MKPLSPRGSSNNVESTLLLAWFCDKPLQNSSKENVIANTLRLRGWTVNVTKSAGDILPLFKDETKNILRVLVTSTTNGGQNLCQSVRDANKDALIFVWCENALKSSELRNVVYGCWANVINDLEDFENILLIKPHLTIFPTHLPLVVGISGCSHSGKTSLASGLLQTFANSFHIQQDRFFDFNWVKKKIEWKF